MPRPLSDEEVEDLRRTVTGNQPKDLSERWLAARQLVAVPFEPYRHFDEGEADRLARGLADQGHSEVWGLSTEAVGELLVAEGRTISVDAADLLRWNDEYSLVDALIVAPDCGSAVLFTVDEYAIAAGPPSFVEQFLGQSVEDAWRGFVEYAWDMSSASRHLPEVCRRYMPKAAWNDLAFPEAT